MKGKKVKIVEIARCHGGFGEWETTGQVTLADFVRFRPDLDGLIRNSIGPAVEGYCDELGKPVLGCAVNRPHCGKLV